MEDLRAFSDAELDDAMLARYLGGESDVVERRRVEQIVLVSRGARGTLEEARAAWVAGGTTVVQGDVEAFLQQLRAVRKGSPVVPLELEKRKPARRIFPSRMWGISSALVLALVFVVAHYLSTSRASDKPLRPIMTYATHNGQRADLELTDGTKVSLNVGSRLDIPAGFGQTTRTLQVTGEVYFDVAHTTSHPFIVIVNGVSTRVLGTRFSVRAYATDTAVKISVLSGRVVTSTPQQRSLQLPPTTLSNGDVATIGASGVVHRDGHADMNTLLGWRHGTLVLPATSLRNAIPDLNRWYDAEFQLGDAAVGDRIIKGSLPGGSLADISNVLELALDVRVIRQGRHLTLYTRKRQ